MIIFDLRPLVFDFVMIIIVIGLFIIKDDFKVLSNQ